MNHRAYIAVCYIALSLGCGAAVAKDTVFRKIDLPYGISLAVPSHWEVLPPETRSNIRAYGSAISSNAGIAPSGAQRESLLAVVATPAPTGATIRVSTSSPPAYTQEDLASTSPQDLDELRRELVLQNQRIAAAGDPKVVDGPSLRIEFFNTHRALVSSYVRSSADASDPSSWQVTVYTIPISDRSILITLSHRQSDALLWQPILEHVRRSVRF